MTRPVVGLGAGGHAKVVIDILRTAASFRIEGLLDPSSELWHTSVSGVPVLGDDSLLEDLLRKGVRHAFLGVGGVGDNRPRVRLYSLIQDSGLKVVPAIHPSAVISPAAEIGPGPTIAAGAIVNSHAEVGENVLLNTGSIVEHDCLVEDHVHIATGARLSGGVSVGRGAHIGAGATVRERVRIGPGAVVGAGSVVVKDVLAGRVVVGVPARDLRRGPS